MAHGNVCCRNPCFAWDTTQHLSNISLKSLCSSSSSSQMVQLHAMVTLCSVAGAYLTVLEAVQLQNRSYSLLLCVALFCQTTFACGMPLSSTLAAHSACDNAVRVERHQAYPSTLGLCVKLDSADLYIAYGRRPPQSWRQIVRAYCIAIPASMAFLHGANALIPH